MSSPTHRSVYLLIFRSPVFPAHWALWIPRLNSDDPEVKIGKIINAVGDPATGFVREIERGFRLDQVTQSTLTVQLTDRVEAKYIVDSDSTSDDAVDDIERVACEIPPPEKSLKFVQTETSVPGPGRRVAIKNCQTWLRELVLALVHKGILEESAISVLDSSPRN